MARTVQYKFICHDNTLEFDYDVTYMHVMLSQRASHQSLMSEENYTFDDRGETGY